MSATLEALEALEAIDSIDARERAERDPAADELAWLRQRLRQREHELRGLQQIAQILTSHTDVRQITDDIAERAAALMGCERVTVWLAEPGQGGLRVLRARVPSPTGEGAPHTHELLMGQGFAGWVADHLRAINVKDAYRDPRFDAGLDLRLGVRTKSALCQPLVDTMMSPAFGPTRGLIGVIECHDKLEGYFSTSDEELLQVVASQATVVLRNQRLYRELVTNNFELIDTKFALEERTSEMELMFGLERVAAVARDLDEALDGALEMTLQSFPAELAAVVLLERNEVRSFFTVRRCQGPRCDRLPPQVLGLDPLLVHTIVHGQTLTRSEWDSQPPTSPLVERIGAEHFAFLPIARPGEAPLGGLLVVNPHRIPRGFDDRDLEKLHVIASRMALSLVLATAIEEERKAERMAAIGGALSGVVHDLRTPLTLLAGYARLLAREDDPDKRMEIKALHKRQIDQLQTMIHELLAFARGQSEILQRKVWVRDFMAELEEVVRHELAGGETSHGGSVTLILDAPYKGAVRMDDTKVKRALLNLVRNAREAMGEAGGTLTIRVTEESGRVVFRVIDTGPGIPKEMEHRLFQSFATHGKAHGTGLGLAIVKTIVDQHEGTLDVMSSPAGTTFSIGLQPA